MRTRKTCFWQEQQEQAVHVAKACIDKAIVCAKEQRGEEVFFEQRWDLELMRGAVGPELVTVQGAAGRSFSQALAEEDIQWRVTVKKLVEEMVSVEPHEFLEVFDKRCTERSPAYTKYDLKIELGKLY